MGKKNIVNDRFNFDNEIPVMGELIQVDSDFHSAHIWVTLISDDIIYFVQSEHEEPFKNVAGCDWWYVSRSTKKPDWKNAPSSAIALAEIRGQWVWLPRISKLTLVYSEDRPSKTE